MGDLTANFSASEYDVHEPFPDEYKDNLPELAALDQWLRDLAGSPGRVTSAYRSPAHNSEVHGSSTSQHMKGEATDVVFYLTGLRDLASRVLDSIRGGTSPAFGQIIFYPIEGHVHISLPTLGDRNGEVRYAIGPAGSHSYPFLTDAQSQLPYASTAQLHAGFQSPARSSSSGSSAGGTSHGGGANG